MTKRRADVETEDIEGESSPKRTLPFAYQLAKDIAIDLECLTHRPKFELQLKNSKPIGFGQFGTVYEACLIQEEKQCAKDDEYVVKVITNDPNLMFFKRLDTEADAMRAAHAIGLAPKLVDAWTCSSSAGQHKTIGVLVMQRIKHLVPSSVWLSDDDRLKRTGNFIRNLVKFHSKGWVHNDIQPGNILLEKGHESVWLIDYGLAGRIDPDDTRLSLAQLVERPRHPQTPLWTFIAEQKDWISVDHKMSGLEQDDVTKAMRAMGWKDGLFKGQQLEERKSTSTSLLLHEETDKERDIIDPSPLSLLVDCCRIFLACCFGLLG